MTTSMGLIEPFVADPIHGAFVAAPKLQGVHTAYQPVIAMRLWKVLKTLSVPDISLEVTKC
jgi:hypothetical protein